MEIVSGWGVVVVGVVVVGFRVWDVVYTRDLEERLSDLGAIVASGLLCFLF